ncbi:MAG: M16 family metallopeptidase [Bacteroidota bacterium]
MKKWEDVEFVEKSTLKNGMRVVTENVDQVKSVAVGVWVHTGSRDEPDEKAGITHFLEHMLFKGTESRSAYDIALSMESVGGYMNAFTSNEYTCYYTRSLDSELKRSLDVLSDMVGHSVFPEEEMTKEKKVVLEEMKMYRDSPEDTLFESFTNKLFKGHPLGRPILGFEETVTGFTREDLFTYVKNRYQPWNMLLSVAGAVDHEEVCRWAEERFITEGTERKERIYDPVPSHEPFKVEIQRPIEQTHMMMGRRGLHFDDENRYILLLANTVLGGGMSSRLHQNIREKYGYCYSIGTFNQSYTDSGMFGVYIGTDREYVDHVRDLIQKEFDQLRSARVPDRELDEARSQLKGKLLLSQESMSNRMTRLAKSELYYNRFVTLDELVDQIDQVTSDELKSFSESFFNPEAYSETVLFPASTKEKEFIE